MLRFVLAQPEELQHRPLSQTTLSLFKSETKTKEASLENASSGRSHDGSTLVLACLTEIPR